MIPETDDPNFKKLSNSRGVYESSGTNIPLCEFPYTGMALVQSSEDG